MSLLAYGDGAGASSSNAGSGSQALAFASISAGDSLGKQAKTRRLDMELQGCV